MDLSHLVVQASSSGDLIESFAEPHLSDPFLGEASGAFGGLREAVQRLVGKSVTPRWLPIPKDNRDGFVIPPRRNSVPLKRLRSCETHKAGGNVEPIRSASTNAPKWKVRRGTACFFLGALFGVLNVL